MEKRNKVGLARGFIVSSEAVQTRREAIDGKRFAKPLAAAGAAEHARLLNLLTSFLVLDTNLSLAQVREKYFKEYNSDRITTGPSFPLLFQRCFLYLLLFSMSCCLAQYQQFLHHLATTSAGNIPTAVFKGKGQEGGKDNNDDTGANEDGSDETADDTLLLSLKTLKQMLQLTVSAVSKSFPLLCFPFLCPFFLAQSC